MKYEIIIQIDYLYGEIISPKNNLTFNNISMFDLYNIKGD